MLLEELQVQKHRLMKRTGCAEQEILTVNAPLRISPLGAHVDHQDGLVTGLTLDRSILLSFIPRDDDVIRVESQNFNGVVEFSLNAVPAKIPGDWGNYIRGAALALCQHYPLHTGFDGVITGTMPIGGLSSSAAVGVAYLLALETVNDLYLDVEENIQLDRYIENTYLGLQNGILDQSIILLSQQNHLTYLDCQTMDYERIPLPEIHDPFDILVVYSGVEQSLVSTDYNNRVAECQAAALSLSELAGVPVSNPLKLRTISEEIFEAYGSQLPAPLDRRARHFFTENQRVQAGKLAWAAGDLVHMGELMNASGVSSVRDYESGCPHLITLYNLLKDFPGIYGTRFSGGGFRGSCIALSHPDQREAIRGMIETRYPAAHPDIDGKFGVYFCQSDGPARVMRL